MTPKERALAALRRARIDLDDAMMDLDRLPAFDPTAVTYAAHALNNFLNVATVGIELLQDSLEQHHMDGLREGIDSLMQATSLMSHIVARLMHTTVAEARLRSQPVDLAMIVKIGCSYYQKSATPKQIAIGFDVPQDLPKVMGDSVAIGAVLDNLLSNAVKYSPRGTRVQVSAYADKDAVVCRVKDEGPGLSAEDLPKLFQKGLRLSAVPTGGEASSGYGLAVAKEIVTRLKGTIWCESTLGKGSTFFFRLPEAA
jgi:two-component system, sensor histidine kinase LadS